MPRAKKRRPEYREVLGRRVLLHKATGQGYVNLGGRRAYVGTFGAPGMEARAKRAILEHDEDPTGARAAGESLSVNELALAYLDRCERHYRHADGTPTGEAANLATPLLVLKDLYGAEPAKDFGPKKLKATREALIRRGLCRKVCNAHVGRIRAMYRWAAGEELLPAEAWHALQCLPGLRRGRTTAPDYDPVRPVEEGRVEAVLPHLPRPLRALVELQLATGARAGELVILRPCDVDRAGRIWTYTPATHKNEYRAQERVILMGPKAQAVLTPFLLRPPESFAFSPKEVMEERRVAAEAERTTPPNRGNRRGSNRKMKAKVEPGDRFTTRSYARALRSACRKAKVETFATHQLRHAFASRMRKEAGLELANVALGHAPGSAVSAIYGHADRERAAAAIARIG